MAESLSNATLNRRRHRVVLHILGLGPYSPLHLISDQDTFSLLSKLSKHPTQRPWSIPHSIPTTPVQYHQPCTLAQTIPAGAEAVSTDKEQSALTAWYVPNDICVWSMQRSTKDKGKQSKLTLYQSLNLRRPASPFAQPREYKRALPSELFGELSKLSEPKLQ